MGIKFQHMYPGDRHFSQAIAEWDIWKGTAVKWDEHSVARMVRPRRTRIEVRTRRSLPHAASQTHKVHIRSVGKQDFRQMPYLLLRVKENLTTAKALPSPIVKSKWQHHHSHSEPPAELCWRQHFAPSSPKSLLRIPFGKSSGSSWKAFETLGLQLGTVISASLWRMDWQETWPETAEF